MWEHAAAMAETRQIRGGDATVKLRSPVNAALISFFTIGLYVLWWYYAINKELADLGRARGTEELGTKPFNSFLALFPGGLVLVPSLISDYNTGNRILAAQRGSGAGESVNPIIVPVLLFVFWPIGVFYTQSELNKVWAAETEAGATQAAQPAQPPSAPPA